MAWSVADYNDFLEMAQDAFGADRAEAQELYRDLRDVLDIGPLAVDDLVEYADVASDLVASIIDGYEEEWRALAPEGVEREPGEELPDEELEYDYEFDWMDEWFEVGDEIEITADLHYE